MSETESNHAGSGEAKRSRSAESAASFPIPEHELLRCIGKGSYGQVWLARSTMGVFRAVKIVLRSAFDSERPFERERSGIQKFEPISRSHEGFIDVLQVGINKELGFFYYIMEVGDDQRSGQKINPADYVPNSLASEIHRRGRISLQECLQLGVALSYALAELHRHELVHRDIKPSNIIFVNGVPKLADIGLVAPTKEAQSYVGTEGFIPPEGPGTPSADVYSLGKVLYEASTGKDRNDFPIMPPEWTQLPEYGGLLELNELLLKACKPNLKDRYGSAWDMHEDLLLVINGKSLKRLRQLERRVANLKKIIASGVVGLALAGIVFYQIYHEWRIRTEAHQRQVTANVRYGNHAMDSGDLLGALPFYAEALQLDRGNADHERTDRLRFGSTLSQCPKLTQMWFAGKQVEDAEFSPDGRNVVLAEYYGNPEVHDIQTGALLSLPFGPKHGLRSAVYSPDGRYILTASESHLAILWDATSFLQLLQFPHPDRVYTARFNPDGLRIVTACRDGVARIWDVRTGRLQLAIPAHRDAVLFAEFSHNGKLIVTASRDGTARVWNAQDGEPVAPPLHHKRWVNCAAFSIDDQSVVTACDDYKARMWDVATGNRIRPDLDHDDAVESVEFSPDGRIIVTASFDGTVRLWRADDLRPLAPYPVLRQSDRMTHASFDSEGRRIITTSIDGTVRIWDLAGAATLPQSKIGFCSRDGSRLLTVTSRTCQVWDTVADTCISSKFSVESPIENAQLSANGRYLLTISASTTNMDQCRQLMVWSTDTGRPIGPAISVSNVVTTTGLSDDGQQVVVCAGRIARVWDSRKASAVSPPLLHSAPVTTALFNPAGTLLATVTDTNVLVWAIPAGRLVFPPLGHAVAVDYIEFSKSGKYLVTCSSDPELTKCSAQIWSTRTGRRICPPLRHNDGVLSARFSPDDRLVATGSEDFTARVWQTATGKPVGLPLRHASHVRAVAFSADGKWLATASADHTARIWDPENTDPLTPPLQHLRVLTDIQFLPDQRHFITEDSQSNVFLWTLPIDNRPPADLSRLAEFLSGSSISQAEFTTRAPEALKLAWQHLRERYPESFSTSLPDILRWHQFQVEQSESQDQWSAAIFHLNWLIKLGAETPELSKSLATAEAHLKNQ